MQPKRDATASAMYRKAAGQIATLARMKQCVQTPDLTLSGYRSQACERGLSDAVQLFGGAAIKHASRLRTLAVLSALLPGAGSSHDLWSPLLPSAAERRAKGLRVPFFFVHIRGLDRPQSLSSMLSHESGVCQSVKGPAGIGLMSLLLLALIDLRGGGRFFSKFWSAYASKSSGVRIQ